MSLNKQSKQHTQDELQSYKKIQNYVYFSKQKLGQGNFSEVYKGIDQNTNKYVAIKVIKYLTLTNKVSQQLLKNQVMILRQLNHENIIKCMDVFTSKNNCYIVTDYCQGGDLERMLEYKKYFEQKQISKIIYGIYKALIYLNEKNIVHRDLKPANILLTNNGIVKIGDFGFAVKSNKQFKDINIGSPIYMSPQGLLKHQYGPKSQVWSFGIIIYQLLHGYTPLSYCKDQKSLKQTIKIMPKFKQQLSVQIKKLLELCFIVDVKQRPQIKQLLHTKYILKLVNQYQKHNIVIDLYSTYHTNSINSNNKNYNINRKHVNNFLVYVGDIGTYQQGLSILQYCRLIHKTTQNISNVNIKSNVLSQWLLDICGALQNIKIFHGDVESNKKLINTICQYYIKYKKQHVLEVSVNVNGHDVVVECQNLKRMVIGIGYMGNMGGGGNGHGHIVERIEQSYLNMLIGQTQMLLKFAEAKKISVYAKMSQIQKYLENMKMRKTHGTVNSI